MINWILKFIPEEYKVSVAIKKVAWTIAKTAIGFAAGTKIGKEIPPEHLKYAEELISLALIGGFKAVHDWARMKWPDVKWL